MVVLIDVRAQICFSRSSFLLPKVDHNIMSSKGRAGGARCRWWVRGPVIVLYDRRAGLLLGEMAAQ